jgi:hypothetical protein
MRNLAAICAALACLCAMADTDPGTLPRVGVVPSRTGVLLLPALDTEPWAASVLLQRQLVVRRRAEYEFIARQFNVSGETLAFLAAQRPPQIDLAAVSGRTSANLDALADRTGVNWVVSLTVQEVAGDPHALDGNFHCHCQVWLQVWDATRHGWLENGPFVGHDLGGKASPVWLFKESIDEATRVSLSRLIGPYAQVVKMAPVSSVGDYLRGQTEAFVGDPKVPFAGFGKQWTNPPNP